MTSSSFAPSLICMILVTFSLQLTKSDEIGVDNQSLHVQTAPNASETKAGDQTNYAADKSSNKFVSLEPLAIKPHGEPVTYRSQHRYESAIRPYNGPTPFYYQPRMQLDPMQLDHFSNTSKQFVGELVSGVSKAFHNLFSQARSRSTGSQLNGENIMATASKLLPTASKLFARNSASGLASSNHTEANAKATNETFKQGRVDDLLASSNGIDAINYDLEGQKLRQDIVQKVGHLQTVLTTAIEVSKERRDFISRRILEQTNYRLEQAKERADRILSEPLNSQIAVRTLYTINQGINGIHSFLHGLLDRINISINVKIADPANKTQTKEKETVNSVTTDKTEASDSGQKSQQ